MPALTYSFQQQIRQMAPNVDVIMTKAPVLLGLIGKGEALTQTKFEWQNDFLNSDIVVSSAAYLATDTTIVLGTGEGNRVTQFALIQNGGEVIRVTNVAGDTLTVTRGYDGTTAEAIASGAEMKVISRPKVQGTDVLRKDEHNDRLVSFNYSQIFERYASVSRTQQAVRTYGVDDELDYQVNLRLEELLREANNSLIYGRKYVGTGAAPATSGGLFAFAAEAGSYEKDFAAAEISAKGLNDSVEAVFTRGGTVNTILCAPNVARQVTKLGGSTIQTERGETQTGHQILSFVSDMPGGAISRVVVDLNMPKDRALLLDIDKIKQRDLTSIYDQDATLPGGDYFARSIRGEFGWEIKNAKECVAVLKGISPTVS
ncbi:SU10 major capsid protein [Paenibacillus abyssi]|uniref:Phage protein n=1 Tax=Paenibacillus abyssi TaxID=1340531 RepID=A0A917FK19_9BACL|nr:hypothetical protein GCM10010916_02220 [Paenibacillus abyssi]